MKISLKWLSDHIDIQDYFEKSDELAKILTAAGLEVEAVENKAQQFKNVVVGLITKLERHPNADRLTVCQLDVGDGTPRQIVCGAKNHKAGDKAVVALPGAVLPGNFEIKKSKIRDVESLGMLASESELGLKKESDGILILPADAPVGKSFAEYFGLDDVTLEINVTPNRADCLSHLGLARELSCLLNRPLKPVSAKPETAASVSAKNTVGLEVKDSVQCSRYSGRLIEGVNVAPSPDWLRRRLESVGLNPINNIVDVTNFIMMDLGQPLHAFDAAQIKGSKIVVDKAQPGEKFVTLDGTEMKLNGDELTIRDSERAVCIAGVIGGQNSGVTDSTSRVFLESAHFAMDSVRRTARRHGVQTDSAYRFSRGTDASGVVRALEYATALIQKVAGGQASSDHWDVNAKAQAKAPILVSSEYVAQRLGYPVSSEELENWLKRLGCKVDKGTSGSFAVTPPEFRVDLDQEVDFVEEYGRLSGYDKIPETLPALSYAPLQNDKGFDFETRVAGLARDAGFSQCVNFGFTGSKYQHSILGAVENFKALGLDMDQEPIRVQNPLNEELDVMRVSLIPGLLKNLTHNARHGNSVGRLFEIGQAFGRGPEGYVQKPRLAFAAWGNLQGLWDKSQADELVFFDLKARVQNLLEKLLIHTVQWSPIGEKAPALLHPAQSAAIFIEGRNVGYIGCVHPKWLTDEKIRVPSAIGEIDLNAISRGQPRTVKFKSISKFPSVERDLAFLMPKTLAAGNVSAEIKKAAGPLLQSIDIFDVFSGGSLPEGQVSVAFKMVFQNHAGTLSEEELLNLQKQIIASVDKKFSIKVR